MQVTHNSSFILIFPLQYYSQNALQQISFWMTVNLVTLNSSKTEFLLIRQLSKVQNQGLF